MRASHLLAIAISWSLTVGCVGTPDPASPNPAKVAQKQLSLGEGTATSDGVEMPLGLYKLHVDLEELHASVEVTESRPVAAAGDTNYEVCVNAFFPTPPIKLTGVTMDNEVLRLAYTVTHPFPAPSNMSGPASGANRADLGIGGRLVFFVEENPAAGLPAVSFAETVWVVSMVPGFVANAHSYFTPLYQFGHDPLDVFTYPYRVLVDETDPDCRSNSLTGVPITNSAGYAGNYDPVSGWQASNIGPERCGWTGYGVLHQGQTARGTVEFDLIQLTQLVTATGGFDLDMGLLAYYNDPRGGTTSAARRANRLPSIPTNTDNFFYNMPGGAVWLERGAGEAPVWSAAATSDPVTWSVVHPTWNAPAEGNWGITYCVPGVLGGLDDYVDLDRTPTSGSGTTSDPYTATASVPHPSGLTPGTYWAIMDFQRDPMLGHSFFGMDCDLTFSSGSLRCAIHSLFELEVGP